MRDSKNIYTALLIAKLITQKHYYTVIDTIAQDYCNHTLTILQTMNLDW